jgi:hypothetical protein
VLDKGHGVLVQLKEHVVSLLEHHDVAHNVSDVLHLVRVQQVLGSELDLCHKERLHRSREKADCQLRVQLRLHVDAFFLLL